LESGKEGNYQALDMYFEDLDYDFQDYEWKDPFKS